MSRSEISDSIPEGTIYFLEMLGYSPKTSEGRDDFKSLQHMLKSKRLVRYSGI